MKCAEMDYLILAIVWGGWCALHSVLISTAMTGYMQTRFPGYDNWYRFFYNSFSLITLVLPVYCLKAIESSPVFSWEGVMKLPRFTMLLLAFILFRGGSKKYDLSIFLGLKQLKTGKGSTLLGGNRVFAQTGVFGVIRHPWYAGSLLFAWSVLPVYTTATMITASILSIYLIAGTFLEERKILTEYGESYRKYQKNVSMLFPWKWLVHRLKVFSQAALRQRK